MTPLQQDVFDCLLVAGDDGATAQQVTSWLCCGSQIKTKKSNTYQILHRMIAAGVVRKKDLHTYVLA